MELIDNKKHVIADAYKSFGWWLIGFTDAEGTFSITKYAGRKHVGKFRKEGDRCPYGYTFEFSIQLRDDDKDILFQIKDYLKCGKILYASRSNDRNGCSKGRKDQVSFKVRDFESIITRILPHFDKFPLLSKKQKDYGVFREAALFHKDLLDKGGKVRKWCGTDHARSVEEMRIKLNYGRNDFFNGGVLYRNPFLNNVNRCHIKSWLPGFVDGDGCFSGYTNNGNETQFKFIIKLREDDKVILESIQRILGCGYLRDKPVSSKKRTNSKPQLCYEVLSSIDLYERIIPLFRSNILRAKKRYDFLLFDQAVSLLVLAQKQRGNKYNSHRSPENCKTKEFICDLVKKLHCVKEYR